MENENKELIKKLRDNAELAWASYGYFHLADKNYKPEGWWNKDKKKLDEFINKYNTRPTPTDILNIEYNSLFSGDMSPNQAKRFFERYDLLEYYPKDNSKGFHACLFRDKESKQYTLAIRGSYDSRDYVEADFWNLLIKGQVPRAYYEDMLSFFIECSKKYPDITKPRSLNIAGHSLGGALAQMLALSICDDSNEANINEVYTFNSHLESKKAV